MIRITAEWILPISSDPIHRGWVAIDGGRISAVGTTDSSDAIDLGCSVILPGVVNAHTHLELSFLHQRVPPADRMVGWVRSLLRERRSVADPADPAVVNAARAAIEQARSCGTALVGDVANTFITVPLLREAGLAAHVFYELIGFSLPDPGERVSAARAELETLGCTGMTRCSLAPHAPYSVSPSLFAAIRADLDARPGAVSSVHLGESPEEVEFLRSGSGEWRALLADLGVWNESWRAPGVSPVTYLADLGFLDRSILAVHGVQFEREDLTRLASLGATIVSCPRSNRHVGVGSPPIDAFYASGVNVAFGTDSLASSPDLNVFAELAMARHLAPRVPARQLLRSATFVGARALGFDADFGTIEPGKVASLIAVRVPDGVGDVEEYLVSGIEADAMAWIPQ